MTSEEVKEEQVFIIPPGYNIEAHVAKLTDRTCGDCQMCCKFTGIEAPSASDFFTRRTCADPDRIGLEADTEQTERFESLCRG